MDANTIAPKRMIIGAVRDRFKNTSIVSVLASFELEGEKEFKVIGTHADGTEEEREDFDKKDRSLIQTIFLSKVVRLYKKQTGNTPQKVLLNLDLEGEDIQILVEQNGELLTL